MNVVDTKTSRVIGDPLISFTGYADQTLPTPPKNNHKFQHCDSKGVGEALRSRRTMCFAMVLVRRSCKADVRVLRRVLRRFYDCTIQPLSHSDIGNPKGASRQVIVDGGRL